MDEAEFRQRVSEAARVSSKTVPEGEKHIFKFKYEARASLVALHAELLLLDDAAAPQLAEVALALGSNHLEAEEMGRGQEYIEAALQKLHRLRGAPLVDAAGEPMEATGDPDQRWDHLLLEAYNHLGVLRAGRSEHPKALRFLTAAETLYEENKGSGRDEEFEGRHLRTVFFLAQVYAALGDKPRAAQYCLTTLQKQLQLQQELDRVDWMTNCLHLSGFFLARDDFALADYCVRAAEHVLGTGHGPEEDRLKANVHCAYGKYHTHVLRASLERREQGSDAPLVDGPSEGLFALPIAPPVARLPLVHTFADARAVFQQALPQFERALHYYDFDGECTTHIDIQADVSVLWRQLIAFEPDLERRVSMHKRRVGLYEPLVGRLQVQCYMSYVRKLAYELGEVWNEIGDIRLHQLREGQRVSSKKVNEACEECIRHYERFLCSFQPEQQTNQTCELPEGDTSKQERPKQVDEDYHRTFTLANMHIARQYTRMQSEDFPTAAQRLMAAKDRYLYTIQCMKDYEMTGLEEERRMCEEMAGLLPTKLKELRKKFPH